MCTAFVSYKSGYIAGFNFDVDPQVWPYKIYCKRDIFCIGITAGKTVYKVHGVNSRGQFAVLPYMNGEIETKLHRGAGYQRIDLLNDGYIAGKLSLDGVCDILAGKTLVSTPGTSMHAVYADARRAVLAEPHSGVKELEGFGVCANFPVIARPQDMTNPFFGSDRFEKAEAMLRGCGALDIGGAVEILKAVYQPGKWATRVSFVYSGDENAVYYCENGEFENMKVHRFGA